MARKKIIKTDDEFEGVLLGIVSQLRDYQLCWHLNKNLFLEMKMMDELEITNRKKSKTAFFSWFRFEDDLDKWRVYLISNKHGSDHLLPEMKQADFLFMIRGEISTERKKEIFSSVKQTQAVQLAIEIDHSKLKSKENLMLE